MHHLTIANLAAIEGEPRVLDTDLASALGLTRMRDIRDVIARNYGELETFGSLRFETANPGAKGGRPGRAYYLNEGQALVICALSRTPAAAKVRKGLIDVFMAYRRGELEKPVQVVAHRRRLPTPRVPAPDDMHTRFVSFFRAFRDQPEALADWACALTESVQLSLRDFAGTR